MSKGQYTCSTLTDKQCVYVVKTLCEVASVWGFVSVILREDREVSLCLEARTGKVFAVIDCRVVVKFDVPRSY